MSTPAFERLEGLEDTYDQIQKKAIGGMAEIYLARQKNLDRPVAIKRIKPELKTNKDIRERFKREARSSANLLHQNLAHVYDYRVVGEDAYIVMEWIDGYDLAEVLDAGPLPLDVACMIAYKVAIGLAHIHAHGMIHRDLKPDNIRISTRGEVKIMDLGIAFDPSESTLTQPGVLIGSPHYLSPEQIVGAKLDARADIFAFGITLYEMLTGEKPFRQSDTESVYTRIQKGEYRPPLELRPDLPVFLQKTIENALQKEVASRTSSSNRLAASLQEFILRNYSLNFEARIRQYLLQTKLMSGNPDLIEIEERTLDKIDLNAGAPYQAQWQGHKKDTTGFQDSVRRESWFSRNLLAIIVVALLGAGAALYFSIVKHLPPTAPQELSAPVEPAATGLSPSREAPARVVPNSAPKPKASESKELKLKDVRID